MTTRPHDARHELLEAALYCFSEYGFDGTSIRMIAQRARRPVSLIGHHFGSKDGLYYEVFRYFGSKGPEEFQPAVPAVTPRSRLEAIGLFRELMHSLLRNACPDQAVREDYRVLKHRLMLMEMRKPRPEIVALIKQHMQPWVDQLRAIIRFLRPDLDDQGVNLHGRFILNQVAGQTLIEGLTGAVWGPIALTTFQLAEFLAATGLASLGVTTDPA